MMAEIYTSKHYIWKKDHQKRSKIGVWRENLSFQVERYLPFHYVYHKTSSVGRILIVLAFK